METCLKALTKENYQAASLMFNKAAKDKEQYLRPLSEEAFVKTFLEPVKAVDECFGFYLTEKETDKEVGYVLGHLDGLMKRFFLTMIYVLPDYRRQGCGRKLLEKLEEVMEDYAAKNDLPAPQMEVSYYNPVMLNWNLPGKGDHYHNNAQGVILGSGAHLFLKNLDFRDFDCQNTYHQDFKDYVWPGEKLKKYEKTMAENGLTVEFFDPLKHEDVQGLVDDLDNDLWNRQIPEEIQREGGPRPLLIVNDHGKVRGFAGPIVKQDDGRAWLLGIAVHSSCRGKGCASILFNRMCEEFKKAGCDYMTFFTSESNFARNIYEGAGFRIFASWANMRRRVQKH